MFKNMMARLGQGAAKVDLVLTKNQFMPGESAEGTLVIQGGAVEQKINKMDVHLMTVIRSGEKETTDRIASIPLYHAFTIHPDEKKEFPFHYSLPDNLLLSGNDIAYYFTSELDIAGGVDQTDRDYIEILPPPSLQQILTALAQLGFREKHDSRKLNGYAQEFEFFPTSYLNDQAKELEFIAAIFPEGVRLQLELDLHSFGHEREIKREAFISNEQLQSPGLTELIRQILDEMVQLQHTHPSSHMMHHERPVTQTQPSSGMGMAAGAIGGAAAGIVGGMVLSEMLSGDEEDDGDSDGDEEEEEVEVEEEVEEGEDDE